MLPAVAPLRTTVRRILVYTLALWASSLVFAAVAGMGVIYIAAAVVLGAAFVFLAVRLCQHVSVELSMRLFSYSITYVTLLFSAMALDQLVRSL